MSIISNPDKLRYPVLFSTAFECVVQNAYRDEKKIRKIHSQCRQRALSLLSAEHRIYQLFEWALSNEENKRLETLLPIISTIDRELPFSLRAIDGIVDPHEAEALLRLGEEVFAGNQLAEWDRVSPEVEEWVKITAERASDIVLAGIAEDPENHDRSFLLIFATMFAVRQLIAGLHQWVSRLETGSNELSYVASAIKTIRDAVIFAVLHRLYKEAPSSSDEEPPHSMVSVFQHQFRLYAVSASSEFQDVRTYLGIIEKERATLGEISPVIKTREALPAFASSLRSFVDASGSDLDRNEYPLLPPATLSMVILPLTPEGTAVACSARPSFPDYLLRTPTHKGAEDVETNPATETTDSLSWNNDSGYFVQENGKVYEHCFIERLSPVAAHDPSAVLLHKARNIFSRQLAEWWTEHKELFAALEIIQPAILVLDQEKLWLLCPSEHAEMAAEAGNAKRMPDVGHLPALAGITLRGSWSRLLLPSAVPLEVLDAEEVTEEHHEDNEWRRLIRAEIGERIPSLDWIVKRLSCLGNIVCSHNGKGSHESIFLERNGSVHRVSTSSSVRSTESLPYKVLYGILRTLWVSEQEFYEKCLAKDAVKADEALRE